MEIRYNIWNIKGYVGFYDCDGPSDYNVNINLILNSTYTKKDVINMFCEKHKDKRNVVIGSCEVVHEGLITY
jgi:hypothetical protein